MNFSIKDWQEKSTSNVEKISKQIEEEKNKPSNEIDYNKINNLIYAQLMNGLPLSLYGKR